MSELAIALPAPRVDPARALRRILAGNALSLLGDGLLLPFAAVYFVRAAGFTAAEAGLVLAIMMGASVVLTVPAGIVLDRFGAKRATIVATAAQALSCLALGFAGSFGAALTVATVFGASRAVARPGLDALIGDLTEEGGATEAFAGLNFALNVGFGAGAALGGLLAGVAGVSRWPFVLDAVSYVLFAAVLAGAPAVVRAASSRGAEGGGYRAVLGDRTFLLLLGVGFLVFVGMTQVDVAFPLYTVSVVHLPVGVMGAAALANTIAVVVLQPLVTRRTATIARSRLVVAGAAAFGVCWLLTAAGALLPGRVAPAVALVAALAAMGAAETLLIPVVFGLVNGLAPAELRGRYNGLLWAVVGAAFVAGPLGGGALIGAGQPGLWIVLLLACAAGAAALAEPLRRALPAGLEAAA